MIAQLPRPTVARREVTIALPPPHSRGQQELIETPLSAVVFGGGRWGKTEAEVRRVIRAMVVEPGLYYWVGLSWRSASLKKAWRLISGKWSSAMAAAGVDARRFINQVEHEVRTPGGSTLMFRTAENPQSIAGDGPRGIVCDEFSYYPEDVYTRFILPSTADHGAWLHLIGRPHGENWAARVWREADGRRGWMARHYTIYDNPLIARDVIEGLRDATPPSVWAQEYMAEIGTGDDGVIPLEWVRVAQERWRAWRDAGRPLVEGETFLSVDVSEGGDGDLTTAAFRRGWTIERIEDWTPRQRGDMLPIGDRAVVEAGGGLVIVDAIGVGAMMPAHIRRQGGRAIAYKGSEATKVRDGSGQFGFVNVRSAAWWHLRELLNPATGQPVALPDDPKLAAELSAPRYDVRAGARIAIEDKPSVKKRLGRSPDKADAVVMAFWTRGVMTGRILGGA